jgi:hypothetical protein
VIDGLGPVDGTGAAQQAAAARRTQNTNKTAFSLPVDGGIPPTPPAEVLRALDRVQRVAGELQARGLDVRFDVDATERARVQVVDSKGGLVREIPVARALDLLSGDRPLGELTA